MDMKDSLKRIISLLLSLTLVIQLIPGIVNSTKMDSNEITIDDIKKLSENSELFHLEVLKDSEGNAKIDKKSITWKLVYNKAKEKLEKNRFELVLSEGLELEYTKENGDLDLNSQPIYLDEVFETFDSEILNDISLKYEVEEDNINNENKILNFSRKSEGIYDIQIDEVESTEEIVFTTKILSEDIRSFFSYIVLDGKEKLQSNSEVNIRPRNKIDIPVNIKWVDLKEGIELPEVEIELKNSDEIIERRVLNPGLKDTLFEDLYRYDLKGKEIKYSINQIPIEGFETSILDYEITNRYIDEELKNIEEEIKATVEELLKPTKVEKRLSSSNENIEEEKVDSVNDIIKEPINEKDDKVEELESLEDSQEINIEDIEEIVENEENKEEEIEIVEKENKSEELIEKDSENIVEKKASLIEIDKKNEDELKEEDITDNGVVLKKMLLEDNSLQKNNELSIDTDKNLEMAPMSLMSTGMLRNATRSTGIIVPPLSEPKLFSTSEKPGMDWSAEANFDGLGNIVWTIKMSKIATLLPRYFEMAIKNISGSALDISSDEAYYELSSNRESSSVIESINKTTGNILVSTRLSSANSKNEEVTFKIITPIRELKDEYTLNVRPGVFHIGATPGLGLDKWQFMGDKPDGSQDLTIERPKSRGKLKIKLTADSPEAYKTKKFIIKSGDEYFIEKNTDANGEIVLENLDTSLDYTIEQKEVHDGYNPDPEPIRQNIKIPANGEKLVEFVNTKKKRVQVGINLVDNNNKPLNIGTFILYDEAGNAIGRIEGDIIGGKALFKSDTTNEPVIAEVGTKYKITQIKVADGYAKSEDIIFTVQDSPESIHYEKVVNTETESIRGTITAKVLEPDEETLVGANKAYVGLFDEHGNFVRPEQPTNENGIVVFNDIPLGKYTLKTTSVAYGYIPADEVAVEISSADRNPIKELILKKVGDQSGPKLEFRYYNESSKSWELIPNTNVTFEVKTESGDKLNGTKQKASTEDFIKIEKLTKNNKYIVEYKGITNNSDYLDKYYAFAPTKFTYNNDNEIWTIKLMEREIIENKKYTNRVHINLTEDGTKALSGGRFRLEAIEGDAFEMKYKFEGTTDKDGNLYFNELPKGKYRLTQIVVPYMHEGLTETIADFEITTDNQMKEFSFINKPMVLQTPIELPTIEPKYNNDNEGEYSNSYYPEGDSLYRNRDNKIDKRIEPNYSIPAYSEHRGQGTSISEDKDVIENERAFLWKYAEPSKKGNNIIPGEYIINLAVEGKKPSPPPTTDVVFVLDNSNSMNEVFDNKNSSSSSGNYISRMELLKQSVINLVDKTFPTGVSPSDINVRMGLVNFGHDYIDSVDLTKNPELLKSKLKNKGAGGTFTQEGLIKANEILKDSTADNRLIVLISDGAPTKSYRLNNMTGLSLAKFGNASLLDGPEHIKGDGAANDLTFGDYPGYEEEISVHKKYTVRGPNDRETIVDDHNLATLSEAENIKNNGIKIHSIGINIAADTALTAGGFLPEGKAKENLINISSGEGYYHFINGTFFDKILWDIIPISDKSIIDGVVTDPMGSQVILSNKNNFTQAARIDENLVNGDYHLEFSSAEVEKRFKDNDSKVFLEGDTIKFDKLTLGEREWVKLRYKVNLNTEDPNFNPDKFYLTNGKETTLEYNPKLSTEKYKFGVPAIKLGAIDLKITKEWEDFQTNELPESVSFRIIRSVENDSGEYPPETEWEIVEDNIILNPNNNWTWENGKYIRYNNKGKEFKYKAIEKSQSDLYDLVMNEEIDPITGDYHFKAINIARKGKFTVLKLDEETESKLLPGAEFTLYKKIGEKYEEVRGSDKAEPEITSPNPQITDSNGSLIFKGLKSGTYYLKETKAPDGYAINDSYLEIVVNSVNANIVEFNIPENDEFWFGENGTDNSVGYIALRDELAHPIIIEKVDEDGKTIIKNSPEFNAVFDIYNNEDYDASTEKIVENAIPIAKDLTIGSDGRVKSENVFSPNTEYWLVEKKQPTGYYGLGKPISIILRKDNNGTLNWEIGEGYENYANSFTEINGNEGTIIGIKVINKEINIPHTGGEGSRIFTIIGLLIMGAVVLIRRKRIV